MPVLEQELISRLRLAQFKNESCGRRYCDVHEFDIPKMNCFLHNHISPLDNLITRNKGTIRH
ncbi:unnamed protein product [Tenebrio molitor]|nr:unnamed protein product [Tenebrio molitor]